MKIRKNERGTNPSKIGGSVTEKWVKKTHGFIYHHSMAEQKKRENAFTSSPHNTHTFT